ncbi:MULTISPECIES: pyruvate dehydrogenase complex dihydrolipoamide acetyltransferase [Stappiaceae]|jgi:pyruvate dehydrogenase E2 component (dihydrolipoamide acetyltransferase)|uniref:Acetyltransferase component of pyruvate dehydrogenase complex n=1 Tax=Roseibium aggregatum TaxID=187304 RepID=A0A0M6XX13_9HYPH|nr:MULTISPECIES: pyruvate dehydrogenase complex dihydrolipoamide acetyltransferase [Stappiaceae]QFS99798.1 Dihydrolipoyllysine-residue acetyltransferase component of pyruvate dehydrogenase complex [Labrenzia sp. THAF191b]QFT06112.1 Dihydrolipoyllysine-residue acetyltransferase component of pyruvate dehydrogenase complex [Labrenzia sp. THAF191a]QFT17656.1 Dihydrolipoyllysine-residue acetyltransferase component of pyruvate dehydrogenase complex [Labrenzia sp. THAF187b]CTQ42365.1 Dihydrolipoyllysi
MPINITMPALSPTMEEGNLAKWLVKEGDQVSAGDVIAEIETDKATMEVEAVDEGTVGKIVVAAGTAGVKVNELIAVLLEDGEDASSIDTSGGAAAPASSSGGDKAPAVPESSPAIEVGAKAATDPVPAPKAADGNRIFSSPLARRLAQLNGLDLKALSGSGPHGRIVKRDIEAALAAGTGKAAPAAAAAEAPKAAAAPAMATGPSAEQVLKLFDKDSYELVPHDGMRKTIAKRLTESKQTIPHFYVSVDCELDALLALRAQLNDAAAKDKEGKPAYKLSVNDMTIKALALALRDVPDANVSWTDDNMVMHKHADVGVAVSIPGGLITPIIRRAEEKPLSVISNEMKDYGKRAKERKLKPEEYQGGTTAVSNMGMMGVKNFSAVVNPPHATILAVGAGEKRPVVKNGELAVATVMSVTLSTDHRCVDGALGAELLAAFKGYIENPMSMLV